VDMYVGMDMYGRGHGQGGLGGVIEVHEGLGWLVMVVVVMMRCDLRISLPVGDSGSGSLAYNEQEERSASYSQLQL